MLILNEKKILNPINISWKDNMLRYKVFGGISDTWVILRFPLEIFLYVKLLANHSKVPSPQTLKSYLWKLLRHGVTYHTSNGCFPGSFKRQCQGTCATSELAYL